MPSGLRVLDLPTLLPGPMANLFLAETGAGGIKVEKPNGGDQMRTRITALPLSGLGKHTDGPTANNTGNARS